MSRTESVAQQLLSRCNVVQAPVPVERIAQEVGAIVSYQPFDAEDISGLLYRAAGASPIIGVNSANTKVRQRFTIAHELGHLCLHEGRDLIFERLVRVNFRDATSSTATNEEEIEANRFAAELLMPASLLEQGLRLLIEGKPTSDAELIQRLARRFAVSQQAMEYRLATLGMLTVS